MTERRCGECGCLLVYPDEIETGFCINHFGDWGLDTDYDDWARLHFLDEGWPEPEGNE